MTIYTSCLIVIPNVGNRLRENSSSNSSYSFQKERFRSTLIVLPHTKRKRFIEGIDLQCGIFLPDRTRSQSISPIATISDVFSGDESICEYYPSTKSSRAAESYFDIRHRLLAKSNLFAHTLRDETDYDEYDSFGCSSMGYSYGNEYYHK